LHFFFQDRQVKEESKLKLEETRSTSLPIDYSFNSLSTVSTGDLRALMITRKTIITYLFGILMETEEQML